MSGRTPKASDGDDEHRALGRALDEALEEAIEAVARARRVAEALAPRSETNRVPLRDAPAARAETAIVPAAYKARLDKLYASSLAILERAVELSREVEVHDTGLALELRHSATRIPIFLSDARTSSPGEPCRAAGAAVRDVRARVETARSAGYLGQTHDELVEQLDDLERAIGRVRRKPR